MSNRLGGERNKKNLNRFTSAYLSKQSRLRTEDWIIGGLKLRILLIQIKKHVVNKKKVTGIYRRLKKINDNLERIGNMEIEKKKKYREELISEARRKIRKWKHLKGKSEQRIFLELEILKDLHS